METIDIYKERIAQLETQLANETEKYKKLSDEYTLALNENTESKTKLDQLQSDLNQANEKNGILLQILPNTIQSQGKVEVKKSNTIDDIDPNELYVEGE